MFDTCWTEPLSRTLKSLKNPDEAVRVAVIGIGHELRGDDQAGLAVAKGLKSVLHDRPQLLIVEAGHAPENYTGVLRRFLPDIVLFIDAAEMGEVPGSVGWLPWEATTGVSASTHTMPLYLLAKYLTTELGCQVGLIGIQPVNTTLCAPLSSPVKVAVGQVVELLASSLQD